MVHNFNIWFLAVPFVFLEATVLAVLRLFGQSEGKLRLRRPVRKKGYWTKEQRILFTMQCVALAGLILLESFRGLQQAWIYVILGPWWMRMIAIGIPILLCITGVLLFVNKLARRKDLCFWKDMGLTLAGLVLLIIIVSGEKVLAVSTAIAMAFTIWRIIPLYMKTVQMTVLLLICAGRIIKAGCKALAKTIWSIVGGPTQKIFDHINNERAWAKMTR